MPQPPSTARVVVIGGGAVGCSVLWHLAKAGWTDCVLFEKNELTSGSTWHAAGNCPNFAGGWTMLALQNYSTRLYATLGEETGYPINYHPTGSIRLAHSKERMREFKHVAAMARHMDIGLEIMTPDEMRAVHPFMETHDLEGGLWDPTDGDIDPAQMTQAYARGARNMGATVMRFQPVTGVRRENGEWVVSTTEGETRCEYVVNAAGYRAAEVGRMFGRDVPMATLAHQYLITEPVEALAQRDQKLPLLRDPDISYYLRQEKDALLLGPYERDARVHWNKPEDPMPEDFSFQLYPDDLERLEFYIEDACARVPLLGEAGVTRVVNGPIPYAPDGLPLVGPMPGAPNAFEACVFTFGIVQSGGAGKILSEWIIEGETETDSWAIDPRRFTDYATPEYCEAKAIEVYSHEYGIHYPGIQWPAGRPCHSSPTLPALVEKGAQTGAYGGWERPEWFAQEGDARGMLATFGRPPWFERVGEECRHVAEKAGVLELPGFSRFRVTGAGSVDWLRSLATGGVPKVGRIGLVYFATPKGKVLTEMSCIRTSDETFELLTAAGAKWHDRDWLFAHAAPSISITDETFERTAFLITGPASREIMKALAPETDFEDFPWLTHREATVAGVSVRLVRVSFAGELGWEAHAPLAQARSIHAAIEEAGAPHGLKPFGMLALDSMRLEKGYRGWKSDLTSDYSFFESGLDRWVNLKKDQFVGCEALAAEKARGAARRFVTMTVEDGDGAPIPLSTVLNADGAACGLVLSGGYGHRVGTDIALASLETAEADADAEFSIEIAGVRRAARISPDPALYDPENLRLKS